MISDALDTCSRCGQRPTRIRTAALGPHEIWIVRCACITEAPLVVSDDSPIDFEAER
jgi:hypothetical protein